MNRKLLYGALLCGALGMCAATASAQAEVSKDGRPNNMSSIPPQKTAVTAHDRDFVMKAAQINIAEIMLGKLAEKNGGSDWAKTFGQDMQREHMLAMNDLKETVKTYNVSVPDGTDAKHVALYNKLLRLHGEAFDNAYRTAMIGGHEKAALVFANEIKYGSDAAIRGYAVKTLPAVKMHHMMAMQMTTMTSNGQSMSDEAQGRLRSDPALDAKTQPSEQQNRGLRPFARASCSNSRRSAILINTCWQISRMTVGYVLK